MYCPYCGRDIPSRASICPACGGVVSEAMLASYYRTSPAPSYAADPALSYEYEGSPKRSKIPLIVLLALILAAVAAIAIPLAQESLASQRTDHRVTFLMKTPGYNDEATAIPVQIVGTQANGTAVDKTVYLDGGGNGVVLEPGTYTLSFPGGSILANGTVLVAPQKTQLELEVPEGLARNEFVQVPTKKAVTYTAVAPLDVTDETLEQVYGYAAQNPADRGKADRLLANARQAHQDAVAKKEADTAAIEKAATGTLTASVGDEAQFVGTIEINTPEELATRLDNESIQWNFYDVKLAVLWLDKPRKVNLEGVSSYYYDEDTGYYTYDENGATHSYVEEHEVRCLVLSTDVEGIYSQGDDGTIAAYEGKHVLVSGKISEPDWSTSLIAPIDLANPTIENL